ncbi:MAG: hypothetical protein ACQEP1_02230 [Nanobdellota archaeon]
MKNNVFIIGTIVILMSLSGCAQSGKVTGESPKEEIIFGHCPTMSVIAENIASENERLSLKRYPHTSAALSALNKGEVDIALVGRVAKDNELGNAVERRLREGLTLVGDEKRFISLRNLEETEVHTAVSKDKVEEYLPERTEVVYHDSTAKAIEDGDVVLLDWVDYTDDFGLVIPVDNNMNKIERFRIPVLYSYDDKIIETLDI